MTYMMAADRMPIVFFYIQTTLHLSFISLNYNTKLYPVYIIITIRIRIIYNTNNNIMMLMPYRPSHT